ncbi:MAG: sodium:solute symporter family protein [Pseudomonadota bacterium]|jgi:cation/acetate symporter|uniref:Cation acetate symporter n=1 Tax=Alteromonas alba TaxID=2079529 RepID=A0A2S9VDF4_9ALTE|nr:sodium:solute symporter family protein [Alteromonas alba]MAJ70376.1 cation acetate symporter [Alteromonadaceae bacterium]MDY6927515.1 sodium:solute symporter family protein [Pseudomonadota bacterium]RPH15050.1 MAG: cation acetate symporter [Alteromonadaceae bacterium TMED7]HCL11528.1 cation acetate symporter [Alteromonas sp.]PRO74487.1 cation acetate symporter [Alteromonas alba]|tara:strand:- start:97 stop:1821 length:1725 start_codon:yes stop_codon:yes gene_type:complete
MDVQLLTFIIVGASFALYIAIAIWARAGSTNDFYVAGGGVPPVLNGMATAADWMSAASFISMAGLISFMGYDGAVYLMGWTGGYVLLALCLAPYLRKFGKFTVPDFIGDRYYSQTARTVAVFCAIFVSFTYVAGQMRGVGVVFSRFLEVDIVTGVVIGMAIVFFYTVLGGMKGITYTQVAQYCVLIFAYLVPCVFISVMVTGHILPQTAFGATLADGSGMYMLEKLDQISLALGFAEYTTGTKSTIDVFFITFALMVGTAGLPHVIVRFFTVPKVRDARKSAGWALVFIAILYTTAPALASFGRVNMIETINGPDLAGTPYAEAPTWIKNWEKTGLIEFNDKNGDGNMYYAAGSITDPNSANEVKVDRDIMVLANPEIANLPAWVIALVAAGGVAAALSTSAGLLLVISTSVSHDLLKRNFAPNISDKAELGYARLAAGVAIVIAGYFGINPPGFVAQVVAFAFGLAASSFFPAIIMGIFSKRMNDKGAVAGMVSGIAFTAAYIIYFKFVNPAANVPANWWFGISPEGIGTLGMLVNFAVAYGVFKMTDEAPQEIQEMVESIRFPKGAGEASAH